MGVIFVVVIAIAVAKAHPGVHRSGGYSHSSSTHSSPHSSSTHSSSYGSPHSSSSHGSTHYSSSYSSPHSSSSHKVHKGKRSAEPEPAKYNCETVYETVYEKQCETKYVTEYHKECNTVYEKNVKPSTSKSAILNTRKSAIRSPPHMGMGLISPNPSAN